MTSDEQRLLDPERVAKRGFSTSFRGFDQDEVRRFLEELAGALRANSGEKLLSLPDMQRISSERDELAATVAELEVEVAEQIQQVKRAEIRAEQAENAAAT
ncbi:MAG: DivIVA domain-containing protein, partial [Actinomycetota bacterium]|nr:DivIVA domain-containing protein [Actinomycetota bacterium]